ncbi:PHD-finger [Ostertagia ostertagi]
MDVEILCTSGKCLGDSHIEVSDEDRDFGSSRRENVKKTAVGSKGSRDLRTDQRYLKEDVLQKRRELIKGFFDNAYEPIETTPLRAIRMQSPKHSKARVAMEVFLDIMNELKLTATWNRVYDFTNTLLPLHSPSSRIEDGDDEAACDICLAIDSEPDDEMVFCDGCNLCVHMSCYGLQELPPDEWLCRNPSCLLCPTIGGALKCTDTNQWAHVVCALWIPECRLELDPLLVADVFAYWVKKRLHLNNGKPLIENLQDEIKVVEPEPPQLSYCYMKYVLMFFFASTAG